MPECFSWFAYESAKMLKPQIFSPLPCLHSYLLFLKTPFNVNSLQKDLYVYQQMYLLDILNI